MSFQFSALNKNKLKCSHFETLEVIAVISFTFQSFNHSFIRQKQKTKGTHKNTFEINA